jgi:trans-feruloyl-CoA hydratase/vanillin synthase
MNYRDSMYYALTGHSFDAKAAVEMGLVNKAVPLDALREETLRLAEHLCKLNPETLRATKQAVKSVREMTVDQAHEYLMAKGDQLSLRDRENGYATGIRQFIDNKTYRPGLGPYSRTASQLT